jgi:hypothetical protein
MKTKILALPLVLLAVGCKDRYEGQAGAASSPAASASPYAAGSGAYASPGTAASGAGVAAVVVAVDPAGPRCRRGRRYNVSSGAASRLSDVQAGDQVFVVCDTAPGASASGATSGPGSLMNCSMITMITEAGGAAAGR